MSTQTVRNAARFGPRTLKTALRTFLILLHDTLALFLSPAAQQGDLETNNETAPALLIRLDYIGDYLLWLPSARALVKQLKAEGKKVVFICNPSVEDLALEENIFDELIPLDRAKFGVPGFYRRDFLAKVRARTFSLVVNPTFSREPLFAGSVVRFARAHRKIGFAGDSANTLQWALNMASNWYTQLVEHAPLHETEKNELMLRAVFPEQKLAPDYSRLNLSGKNLEKFALPQTFAVLFPGVSWEGKKWPLERFIQVGIHLQRMHRMNIVLLGAKNERIDAEIIQRGLHPAMTLNFAGETSLKEMIAILGEASLLISNDTSAVHSAALAQVPCVTVVGGGHWGRFLPYPALKTGLLAPSVAQQSKACYGCAWHCIYPREPEQAVPCIDEIPAAAVISLMEAALQGKRGLLHDSAKT